MILTIPSTAILPLWLAVLCGCTINVCFTHHRRQQEAGAFWCGGHGMRAQWFQERYLQ